MLRNTVLNYFIKLYPRQVCRKLYRTEDERVLARRRSKQSQKKYWRTSASKMGSPHCHCSEVKSTATVPIEPQNTHHHLIMSFVPIPHMDNCFESLSKAKILHTLDAHNGFLQVEIEEENDKNSLYFTPRPL